MARIKILNDKLDTSKPSFIPKSSDLNKKVDRIRPTGKPALPLTSSFNKQAK